MNYLINPADVIDYNRDDKQLELFWLFSCVVAGKTASTQAKLLDKFMLSVPGEGRSTSSAVLARRRCWTP